MYNKKEYLFTIYNSLYHSAASFRFCNWKAFSKAEKDMFFTPLFVPLEGSDGLRERFNLQGKYERVNDFRRKVTDRY